MPLIVEDYAAIAQALRDRKGGTVEEEDCPNCSGSGWECYDLGRGDPHFKVCTVCHNLNGYPSP